MMLFGWMRWIYRDDRRLQVTALVGMVVFYGAVLCAHPDQTPGLNRTFNSMLQHLLHGRFDVDPATVGPEGFLRNGRVYAYWGIWGALVRLPLALVRRIDLDVTVWSCLGGICLAGMTKLRTLLLIRRHIVESRETRWAMALMLISIVLGGSEVAYLRASIYQEVIDWAVGFAAVFVYFAIKGLVEGEFTKRALGWMAAMTVFALLTRVSTGIGLLTAFLLLLVWLVGKGAKKGWSGALLQRRFVIPLALLLSGLVLTGTVNYFRWGDPLKFADHRLYLYNLQYPDRMPRTQQYGYFNLRRIPFGLSYFFAPLWALPGSDGHLLFETTQTRLMDAVELPPSSLLLTDMYPMVLIVLLGMAMRIRITRQWVLRGPLPALALGLVVPCLLMLMAISMNYRYRMEFYPEIDLLAFAGLYLSAKDEGAKARLGRWKRVLLVAVIVSVISAMGEIALYKMSEYGPSQVYLREGIVRHYQQVLAP
jgi:hypothetical protein